MSGVTTADFDYHLPDAAIAQHPIEPRDAAKLLVCSLADTTTFADRQVRDLPELLAPGDLLVVNRTRVIPARLNGSKASGGAVEVLLVHPGADPSVWSVLIRGKVRPGTEINLELADGATLTATVTACHDDGSRDLAFPPGTDVLAVANAVGHLPLPPYIDRPDTEADRERYQTTFGDSPGSVAAPTAGLHFTPELFERLAERGIERASVDLAVGPGTFRPVAVDDPSQHAMHSELAHCPEETVAAINACRARSGRVIAVGTTVVRTLEAATEAGGGTLAPYHDWTDIFLYPPRRLVAVDGLLTNFHLPKSTLLMLVSCLMERDHLLAAYQHAIANAYRFYSYGDAMLVLPGGQPTTDGLA